MNILYILGSTRSGTSALRNAIAMTRYRGYGEGHFAPLLSDIMGGVSYHKAEGVGADVSGTGLYALRENVFVRHLFHAYERYLVKQFNTEFIVDKTPTVDPIRIASDLKKFHANAQFIFCARRHVDNILSKQKKFPNQSLQQHCQEWSGCNSEWLRVREKLEGAYLELDFHELVHQPEQTSTKISNFLNLDKEEYSALLSALVNGRPEQSAPRDLRRSIPLSETGWSQDEQQMVQDLCGAVGDDFGYAFEQYFKQSAQYPLAYDVGKM